MAVDPWLVVAVAAVGSALALRRVMGGSRVSSDVVLQKIQAGAHVVDVRSPEEFRAGAYPGAVNIPLQLLARRLDELPKDRPVVLYCASGLRSGTAARLLTQAGFSDVVNGGGLNRMPR
jgi:phage shock protein E